MKHYNSFYKGDFYDNLNYYNSTLPIYDTYPYHTHSSYGHYGGHYSGHYGGNCDGHYGRHHGRHHDRHHGRYYINRFDSYNRDYVNYLKYK